MAMTLTTDDLAAIDSLFRSDIKELKQGVEGLAIDTAAGFTEVHEKIDAVRTDLDEVKSDLANVKTDVADLKTDVANVKADITSVKLSVGRIERVQQAEVVRADKQELAFMRLRKVVKF